MIEQDIKFDEATWIGFFERMRITELSAGERVGCGWISPVDAEGPLFLNYDSVITLTLSFQTRNLPSSTVKRAISEKLDELAQTGEVITSRRKREVKEDIEAQMLPKAFIEHTDIPIWIDLKKKFILVAAGSDKQADECVSYLRKTLGHLPVILPNLPSATKKLTAAFAGELPSCFDFANQVWMQSAMQQTHRAMFSGCELPDSRVDYALDQGMVVKKLGVKYSEILKLVVTDKMQVSSVSYSTDWRSENQDHAGESSLEMMKLADIILLVPVYRALVEELLNWLGESDANESTQAAQLATAGSQ